MATSVILAIIFFATLTHSQTTPESCPANEVWSTGCTNPCFERCPTTEPHACPEYCKLGGCVCISGYCRDASGSCILPPPQCGPNSQLVKCPNPCAPTCADPNPTGPCTKMCIVEGCQCDEGYAKDANGNCVKLVNGQCQETNTTQCGPHAQFVKCPNPCAPTCVNPNPSPICSKMCLLEGCLCDKGYAREANGNCLKLVNGKCKDKDSSSSSSGSD